MKIETQTYKYSNGEREPPCLLFLSLQLH